GTRINDPQAATALARVLQQRMQRRHVDGQHISPQLFVLEAGGPVDGGSVKGEVGFRLVHQPGQALYVPEIERNVAEPRRGSHVSAVGIPANAGLRSAAQSTMTRVMLYHCSSTLPLVDAP